jgi:uncharacterized protein (DUF4415 family)
MSAKLKNTPTEWVDPDDAPELTDEFFEKATPMIGDRVVSFDEFTVAAKEVVSRGRPKAESTKLALTVRYDVEVVEAFKATGKGWQTRMNAALRDWLKTHSPA